MSLRKNIMLGTAGHVDHGKTAVVKLLTGCDTDTLTEEKERGMTIDLGFAPCKLSGDRVVGIVDVPGHADFIRNMVAGAHGIDVVIFVVAADDGVMPQTREHLNILTLMGLKHGVVALTKIDLVSPDARDRVVADVRRLLFGTFLAEAPICPLSTITGEGFGEFYDTLDSTVNSCQDRACSGLFHLWIEDVFTVRGSGTIVTGIPTNGIIRAGDHLQIMPGGQSSRVRRLQVYGADSPEARAGECVALNLAELDHEKARRGLVLGAPDSFAPVEWIEAELLLLSGFKGELKDHTEVHFHIGTAAVAARISMLEKFRMQADEKQMIQLRLMQPLGIAPGERFVIRANDPSKPEGGLTTIGGGRVLGVGNLKLRRNKPWVLESLSARRDAMDDPQKWCGVIIKQLGVACSTLEIARACFHSTEETQRHLGALKTANVVQQLPGDKWLHREVIQAASALLLQRLQEFHREHADRLGLAAGELAIQVKMDGLVFQQAIQWLLLESKIRQNGDVLCLAGWKAQVTSQEDLLCRQAEQLYKMAKWTPPRAEELAASIKQPPARTAQIIRLLVDKGVLKQVCPEFAFHKDAIEEAKQAVLRLFSKNTSFTTMDFRDALGVSRKFAVPLVDYLDSIRFTARSGNTRTPGAEAKKMMETK